MRRPVRVLLAFLLIAAGIVTAPSAEAAGHSRLERGLAATPPSDPSAIALPAYRDELQSALRQLRDRREAGARDVAMILQRTGPVSMPDGSQVRPDLSEVIAALETQPPDLAGGESRLAALLAELDRAGSLPGSSGGSDARDRLQRVLERPEFHPAQSPTDPVREFLTSLWNSFWGWFKEVFAPIGRLIPPVDLHLPAVVTGLLVVGGLIFWVVRGFRGTMGPGVIQVPDSFSGQRPSPVGLRAEALDLAQRGEFRAAIRALYLAVLLQWDERGKLLFDRALTNREVLEQLSGGDDTAAVQRLAPLVERFDRFWYGAVPCSSEDYADFARLAASAWESVWDRS